MATQSLQERLKNWWLLLLSGILFVLLGFYIFSQPLASYLALSLFFATAFLVSGIFEVAYAFSSKQYDAGWGWALWNFTGGFGICDSGRTDVAYENWHGRKLDRAMVELLQRG